jgi:hypothetical protein
MLFFLRRETSGNIAIVFALILPVLLAAAGVGLDFQQRRAQETALQDAADNLALRAARELLIENATEQGVEALVRAWADAQYAPTLGAFTISPEIDKQELTAFVEFEQPLKEGLFFSNLFGSDDAIKAEALAQAQGVTNVCVIALEKTKDYAVRAALSAKLDAPKCAIMSNSTSSRGVSASGSSKISANMICSAGGKEGSGLNFSPMPLTDCPSYEDPLGQRPPPTVGACDETNLQLGQSASLASLSTIAAAADAATATSPLPGYTRYDLKPGVYCGGLRIKSFADVHLSPGIYVMKDGPLIAELGARLVGENVGFYLTGDTSTFIFGPESIISLSAPTDGEMSGLPFFEDRLAPDDRLHQILSSNARTLIGTIYLPRGILSVASLRPVASESAYTAIVAKKLSLIGSPTLVLNADYADTDVPVPDGVGPTGGTVRLRN